MRLSVLFTAAFLVLQSFPAFADADVIGTIMEVEGTATISGSGADAVGAEVNTEVHTNDVITTGAQSRAVVLLADDTQFILSENSSLRVDEYIFDQEDVSENTGVYSVLKGTFLYVSGLMTKRPDPDVTVNTEIGSIGIRGTQFWGGPIDGAFGLLVNEGEVKVKTWGGERTIGKGLGSMIRSKSAAPDAPKVWKPEKIERATKTVFLQRQAEVRQRIEAHREKQGVLRKALLEKRKMRHEKLKQRREDLRQNRQEKMKDLREQNQDRREDRRNLHREGREDRPGLKDRRLDPAPRRKLGPAGK